jgi:hypothetical protein
MGIYSHLTDAELVGKRDSLLAAIETAASGVASAGQGGRHISYQQNLSEARRLLTEVQAELERRAGRVVRAPIYMVS